MFASSDDDGDGDGDGDAGSGKHCSCKKISSSHESFEGMEWAFIKTRLEIFQWTTTFEKIFLKSFFVLG